MLLMPGSTMHTFMPSFFWRYRFKVSYTIHCMAGFSARTSDGLTPLHSCETPSSRTIRRKQSVSVKNTTNYKVCSQHGSVTVKHVGFIDFNIQEEGGLGGGRYLGGEGRYPGEKVGIGGGGCRYLGEVSRGWVYLPPPLQVLTPRGLYGSQCKCSDGAIVTLLCVCHHI